MWKDELKKIMKQEYGNNDELSESKIRDLIESLLKKEYKRGQIDENEMYHKSMTSVYYSDMNDNNENTVWLKIRDLFEKRISELEGGSE